MPSNKLRVSLGCGNRSHGLIGIDRRPFKPVDYILDVEKDLLPFDNDSVEYIEAIHLFEHLTPEGLFHCVDECWRVLEPLGYLHIAVPKAGTPAYYAHPDHKIQFIEDTFAFWQVPAEGRDAHGYLKYFWHVQIVEDECSWDQIVVNQYPNKIGGRWNFVPIVLLENQ